LSGVRLSGESSIHIEVFDQAVIAGVGHGGTLPPCALAAINNDALAL